MEERSTQETAMPNEPKRNDYGGRDENRRLSFPGRTDSWARMSPAPFINRRSPGRNWVREFPLWTEVPAAATDQLSIDAAVLDAVTFEVIRHASEVAPILSQSSSGLRADIEQAFAAYRSPDGVRDRSLYDALQALAGSAPLPIPGGQSIGINYTRLPMDMEYWRDWLARRGPIVSMIWVDQAFREGRYDREKIYQEPAADSTPAAVVVSGYEFAFARESTELRSNSYYLRPAFQVGDNPHRRSLEVTGNFADHHFIEGFGLTAAVFPFVRPDQPHGTTGGSNPYTGSGDPTG
jgi:hypothetical protein